MPLVEDGPPVGRLEEGVPLHLPRPAGAAYEVFFFWWWWWWGLGVSCVRISCVCESEHKQTPHHKESHNARTEALQRVSDEERLHQ